MMKNIRLALAILSFCLFCIEAPAAVQSQDDNSNNAFAKKEMVSENRDGGPFKVLFWIVSPLLLASAASIYLLIVDKKKNQKEILRLKSELKQAKKLHLRDIEAYKDRELSVTIIEQEKCNSLIEKMMIKTQRLRDNFQERQRLGFNTMLADLDKLLDNNLWNKLERSFTEIHPRYIKKLKAQYPDLTLNEVKVCILIRINLTSKEISKLTDLSIKSIEAIRTKLRKRFGLMENNLLLNDFLSEFN